MFRDATQTVFGEGPPTAWLMLIGEQPGDREDIEGAPFVGPAGRVLDKALHRAGIIRDGVYVTNAVKHFRFERDGNRRIHKTPGVTHIRTCRPWLDGELRAVRPTALATLHASTVAHDPGDARTAYEAVANLWSAYGYQDAPDQVLRMLVTAIEIGYLAAMNDVRDGDLDDEIRRWRPELTEA